MKSPTGHIRRLHLVDLLTDGTIDPIADRGALECAKVEREGFEPLEEMSRETWGDFNYLIWSEGQTYLAAIY